MPCQDWATLFLCLAPQQVPLGSPLNCYACSCVSLLPFKCYSMCRAGPAMVLCNEAVATLKYCRTRWPVTPGAMCPSRLFSGIGSSSRSITDVMGHRDRGGHGLIDVEQGGTSYAWGSGGQGARQRPAAAALKISHMQTAGWPVTSG